VSEDDDLRINTLNRFEKYSARLVLREYSHCEVPAGCGGVVLRWVDPSAGLPVVIRVTSTVPCETWLDGAPVTSRGYVRTGPHVLSLRTTSAETALLAIKIGLDAPGEDRDILAGRPALLVRWTDPGAGWTALDAAEDEFGPAAHASARARAEAPDWARWRFDRTIDEGGRVFAVGGAAWMRVRFRVDEDEWTSP